MNERIKQLANKATRIVETTDHCSGESESHTEVDLEKFAELIVKEMLQTCEDHPAWTGRMIGEEIKQHFGVEE